MWATFAIVFVAAGVAAMVLTEVVRGIVDRHRVRTQGLGGTQDVAIYGMCAMVCCILGCVVSSLIWLLTR